MFQSLKQALSRVQPGYLTVAGFLFATALIFAVGYYSHRQTPQPKAAVVSKATAAAVNTVQATAKTEASRTATVKEAVNHVQETTHASDDLGDTGRAGLTGLCGMRSYAETDQCRKLSRDGAGRLQVEAGDHTSAR